MGCSCEKVGFFYPCVLAHFFSWQHGNDGRIFSDDTNRLTFFLNTPRAVGGFFHVWVIVKTRLKL